ncbi:hypothetical protein STEG23_038112 [Scotinomys teguina]
MERQQLRDTHKQPYQSDVRSVPYCQYSFMTYGNVLDAFLLDYDVTYSREKEVSVLKSLHLNVWYVTTKAMQIYWDHEIATVTSLEEGHFVPKEDKLPNGNVSEAQRQQREETPACHEEEKMKEIRNAAGPVGGRPEQFIDNRLINKKQIDQ